MYKLIPLLGLIACLSPRPSSQGTNDTATDESLRPTKPVPVDPLELTPEVATVTIGCDATVALMASGGVPPWTFSVRSGNGSADAETGVFTVPPAPGVTVVQVRDAEGATAETTITIDAPLATTWSTVDDYVYPGTVSCVAYSIGADDSGGVYAIGVGASKEVTRWLVRRTEDDGNNWETVDDFVYPGAVESVAAEIAVDPNGTIYVGGYAYLGVPVRPVLRKSEDQGRTWTRLPTIEDSDLAEASLSMLAVGPDGRLFAGHFTIVSEAMDDAVWLVRVSDDGGKTWSDADRWTVDPERRDDDIRAFVGGFAADEHGDLYVAGYVHDGNDDHWLVRKSEDDGVTWSTVDDFIPSGEKEARAKSVVAQGSRISVAGTVEMDDGEQRWGVRVTEDGGKSWLFDEDYQYPEGDAAVPFRMVESPASVLYTAGIGWSDADVAYRWLVRKKGVFDKDWGPSDDFFYEGSIGSFPYGVAMSARGSQYVAGAVDFQAGVLTRWVVRREQSVCP